MTTAEIFLPCYFIIKGCLIIDVKDVLFKTKTIADYHAHIHLDLRIDISGKILYFAGSKRIVEIAFVSDIMFSKRRKILD